LKIQNICSRLIILLCLLILGFSKPVQSQDWKTNGSSVRRAGSLTPRAGSSTPSVRVQNFQSASSSTQSVRQFFNQYKSLDLANSTQIMNLYANDATIDVVGTRYNKASYSRYVANAYHNPASGLNSHTVYGEPNIQVTGDSAQASFTGVLGPTSMYVYWNLRRNPSGAWQITSERFVKPAVSLTSANSRPSPSVNAQYQNLPDGVKQMNDNPDMKAFVERIRKLREQQKN